MKERSGSQCEAKRACMVALVLLFASMITGCGGKPFNVRERPFKVKEGADPAPAVFDAQAQYGLVTIQAEAVRDEDYLYDTFDANLILAGVLPIRVMIANAGQEPLDLKSARFEARAQAGRSFKPADAKRAFKRLISYYGISTYSKSGYKESQEDFLSHALDTNTPLAPGQSRQGLLFFLVPGEVAQSTGITLIANGLGPKQSGKDSSVELKLK